MFAEGIESFAAEKNAAGADCIVIYTRVAPSDRAPSSPLQKLLIERSRITE
jgi:hypothetical protein